MKNVRNIVIGTVIATLIFAMLATPAAAIPTVEAYVDPDGSGNVVGSDVVRDQNGDPLCVGYLIQSIWDVSQDGITPPDPDDLTKCTSTDDLVKDTIYFGPEADYPGCCGKFNYALGVYKGVDDRYYLRAWNAATLEEATHYGDSPVYFDMQDGVKYYDWLTGEYDMTGSGFPGDCPLNTSNTWWTSEPKPTLSKNVPMKVGWNLISLCFEPSDNSTSAVLNPISGNYSEVKEWDAVSKTWADATAMDRGTGYFVYVTTACTWEHTGAKKTASMTIPLETGLNLVGYPFDKTNSTSDALSALNYYYAAPFDATAQKYDKTYNPAAPMPPAPFNDFLTIEPCEGFWISSKDGDNWTAA